MVHTVPNTRLCRLQPHDAFSDVGLTGRFRLRIMVMRRLQGAVLARGWRAVGWGCSLAQWRLYVYRAMIEDQDSLPKLERSARALGLRIEPIPGVPADIDVDASGFVKRGHGGMSLTIGSPRNLPPHRRPRAFGGTGRDPVFMLMTPLWAAVRIHVDNPEEHHACMEPLMRCSLEAFERELAATRPYWRKVE